MVLACSFTVAQVAMASPSGAGSVAVAGSGEPSSLPVETGLPKVFIVYSRRNTCSEGCEV